MNALYEEIDRLKEEVVMLEKACTRYRDWYEETKAELRQVRYERDRLLEKIGGSYGN